MIGRNAEEILVVDDDEAKFKLTAGEVTTERDKEPLSFGRLKKQEPNETRIL